MGFSMGEIDDFLDRLTPEVVEEVSEPAMEDVYMDDEGDAVFTSYPQILRFVYQPQYSVMCYVRDDVKKREEEAEDNRGIGKTFGLIVMIYDLLHYFKDYVVVTNVQFSKYLGNDRWQRKNAHPKRVHYAITMWDVLKIAADIRRKDPSQNVVAVIDEFSTFLNQLESSSQGARILQKILDIPRKLFICMVGIGPNFEQFPKTFRRMATIKLFKSLKGLIDLRKEGCRTSSGGQLTMENTMFVSARSKRGIVDEWFEVRTCPWTHYPPRVGQTIYETWAVAQFKMDDMFLKNYFELLRILDSEELSSYDQAGIAEAIYDFMVGVEKREKEKTSRENLEELQESAMKYFALTWGRKDKKEKVVKGRYVDGKTRKKKRDLVDVSMSDSFIARLLGDVNINKYRSVVQENSD